MSLATHELLKVKIDNYSGPLEVLLDLAKSQKVDLANISITQLADQFIEFINSAKELNLDLASEYLLMATWLAYLKSKLLLPQEEEDEFKISEVAEKLKSQLKKLELIRLLSDQLLKKNRLGIDIRTRGISGGVRLIKSSKYVVSLYELLKSYSNHVMVKNFLSINIPKLPVYTTQLAIDNIKEASAPGPDGISNKVLKELILKYLSNQLIFLYLLLLFLYLALSYKLAILEYLLIKNFFSLYD